MSDLPEAKVFIPEFPMLSMRKSTPIDITKIFTTAMHARVRVQRVQEQPKDEMKGLSTNQDLSTVRKMGPVNNQGNPFANVGPNDRCPCGSGKKFKFCHGLKR